jgi:hypothetical protein
MDANDKDIVLAEYQHLWHYYDLTLEIRENYFANYIKALSLLGAVATGLMYLAVTETLPIDVKQSLFASATLMSAFAVIGYHTIIAIARQTANSNLYYDTISDLRDTLWSESILKKSNAAKLHLVRKYKSNDPKPAAKVTDSWRVLPCTINALVVGAAVFMFAESSRSFVPLAFELGSPFLFGAYSLILSTLAIIVSSAWFLNAWSLASTQYTNDRLGVAGAKAAQEKEK